MKALLKLLSPIHLRWARHHWPVILSLLLGIIAATGLAATGPALVNQLLSFAFRRNLLNAPVEEGHLRLSLRDELDDAGFAEIDDRVQEIVASHFATIPHDIFASGNLPTLIPWQENRLAATQRVNVRFYGDDIRKRVTVVAGSWPAEEIVETHIVAVVIGEPLAEAYELDVGDRLGVSKTASAMGPELWFEVAAIVQPIDGQDPFWFGQFSPLRVREDGRFRQYSALISRETFFTLVGTHFPGQSPSFVWPLLVDAGRLTLDNIPNLQNRLAALPDRLFQVDPQLSLATGLPDTVARFAGGANSVRTPLSFLTATTALLAFFFVAMAASLATIRMQGEWDLMHSRGIASRRLLEQQLVRTMLLTLIALALGALVAGLLLRALAMAGPLADISEPDWAGEWPTTHWTALLVAAIACILVILWPFIGLSRRSISNRLQTLYRPPRASWWQRTYIDVITGVVGLILLARFVSGGGFISAQAVGAGTDWLLVLAPIATMLGGLAILLRLFPPLLNAISRMFARWPQSVPFLALAYAARSHKQGARLVLLFALTVSLGIFAASVDDALTHNEIARAQYATGGQIRLVGTHTSVSTQTPPASTAVWRGAGTFEFSINRSYPTFDLLAIEPDTFLQVANLRPDFASEPIRSLVMRLQPPDVTTVAGLPIPPSAATLGLWLTMPTEDAAHWQGINLEMKVTDSNGNAFLLPLAQTGESEEGWRRFEVDLPSTDFTRFNSLWFHSATFRAGFRQNLAYDDIIATDLDGRETLLEGFEDLSRNYHEGRFWASTNPQDVFPYYYTSGFEPRSGKIKLEFSFGRTGISPGRWYGLTPYDLDDIEEFVLPALVSREFIELTASDVDDQLLLRVRQSPVNSQPVLVRIAGIVDYFPTMYAGTEAGYIVTARDPLLALFNNNRHDAMQPNELLMIDAPSPELANQAVHLIDLATVQRTLRAFPLAVGLRTASLLGYILATIISLGSFAAHLVFTISQRRSQFAVLRAIGLESGQLYNLLLVEQLVLVFSGLILGTVLGAILTWFTLSNLNFDWGGLAAAPPFEAVWDWGATIRTYGLFISTVLLAIIIAIVVIRRAGLGRALTVAMD
jgi:hypothetical protein